MYAPQSRLPSSPRTGARRHSSPSPIFSRALTLPTPFRPIRENSSRQALETHQTVALSVALGAQAVATPNVPCPPSGVPHQLGLGSRAGKRPTPDWPNSEAPFRRLGNDRRHTRGPSHHSDMASSSLLRHLDNMSHSIHRRAYDENRNHRLLHSTALRRTSLRPSSTTLPSSFTTAAFCPCRTDHAIVPGSVPKNSSDARRSFCRHAKRNRRQR